MTTHPQVFVTVDGTPVSGGFFDRLVSLTVTDQEGIQSDTLRMVLDDSPPHVASPRRGARAAVAFVADGQAIPVGSFVVDRFDRSCLPYTISLAGHSADLRADMKTSKSRHWDDASVRQIVEQIAGEYELEPKISDSVSAHVYEWIGQNNETDPGFLTRVAKRHGALFSIKDGKLLWLDRGKGAAADGTLVPPYTVVPASLVVGSFRISETDVGQHATVSAYYQDRAGAQRRKVTVEGNSEAEGDHALDGVFSSLEEARIAAEAYAKEMKRGQVRLSCNLIGQPGLLAGQPVSVSGVHVDVDGMQFILESVVHSYSKSGGLQTAITAKLRA